MFEANLVCNRRDAGLQVLPSRSFEPAVSSEEVAAESQRGPLPESTENNNATDKKQRNRQNHPGRNELPAHLEPVDKIIPCAPEFCTCGKCGGDTKVIGYEVSEVLDRDRVEHQLGGELDAPHRDRQEELAAPGQQGGGAKNRRHLQHRRELSQTERAHSPISGRRVARLGRPLHPVSGRTHPGCLCRQISKVAYPRLSIPVNHGVPRTDTVVQRRQGNTLLMAKCPTRQTALFILHDQPIRLFPAPATTCAMCLGLIHEPSTSPAEILGKNGLARRGTFVVLQNGVNDALPGAQLRSPNRLLPLIARRFGELQHLTYGFACQAELPCYIPLATPLDSNCPSDSRIQFHGVHPSGI